ncbi:hypothetical protein [Bartonella massiliensis]|nr:hypothetical protein [Bartonella massiliensis]
MRPYMQSRLMTYIAESLVSEIHKAYTPIDLPRNPPLEKTTLYKP